MPFVIDASATANWLLPDENASPGTLDRLANDRAIVPALWRFEIWNFLLMAERRQRIDIRQTTSALTLLATLPIAVDHETNQETIFELARTHRLTSYDSVYLELALRLGLALVTTDAKLVAAASAENVQVI